MSLEAYKWAKTVEGISHSEKLLLIMIADHYSDELKRAWPSRETLARECCMSMRTVTRGIKSLEERGLIRVQRWINNENGHNLSNRYSLPIFDPQWASQDKRKFVHAQPFPDRITGKVSFIDDYLEEVG